MQWRKYLKNLYVLCTAHKIRPSHEEAIYIMQNYSVMEFDWFFECGICLIAQIPFPTSIFQLQLAHLEILHFET